MRCRVAQHRVWHDFLFCNRTSDLISHLKTGVWAVTAKESLVNGGSPEFGTVHQSGEGEVDDSCVSSVGVVVEPRDSSDLCSGRRRESEGLQSNH